jgi:hypothetical protein
MHVNICGRDLTRTSLAAHVEQVLQRHQATPGSLTLELTETMLMGRLDVALRTMASLRASGVRFSIDDFGTGYSSLSYLGRLPIDSLKIDRSFVMAMHESRQNLEIVRAMLTLGRTLGHKVIAEGVETEGSAGDAARARRARRAGLSSGASDGRGAGQRSVRRQRVRRGSGRFGSARLSSLHTPGSAHGAWPTQAHGPRHEATPHAMHQSFAAAETAAVTAAAPAPHRCIHAMPVQGMRPQRACGDRCVQQSAAYRTRPALPPCRFPACPLPCALLPALASWA